MFGGSMKFVVLFLLSVFLVACEPKDKKENVAIVPEGKKEDVVIQPYPPLQRPINGWPTDYDRFIKAEVGKYPGLLSVSKERMGSFEPNWGTMSEDQKKTFYANLVFGMAKEESGHSRISLYFENKFKNKDKVTGLPVVSEGLMQLSYQDKQWYKFCQFDYAKDKAMHEADWKARPAGKLDWKSGHPDKTILDPYVNLGCAIGIMDSQLKNPKLKDRSFADSLTYWSVMSRKRSQVQGWMKR